MFAAQFPESRVKPRSDTSPMDRQPIARWRTSSCQPRTSDARSQSTARRTTFLKFAPSNPYCPSARSTSGVRTDSEIHVGRTPPVRRSKTPVLPDGSRGTARALPGTVPAGFLPTGRHATCCQSILSVSPFVVVLCPAPPVSTPTDFPLPCRESARPSGRLLLGPHSQATGFEAPH